MEKKGLAVTVNKDKYIYNTRNKIKITQDKYTSTKLLYSIFSVMHVWSRKDMHDSKNVESWRRLSRRAHDMCLQY